MRALGRVRSAALASLCLASFHAPSARAAEPVLPPYAQAYEPQGVDERGMWMLADEDERQLRNSKFVIQDPDLTNYVHGVLCRTVGEERCRNIRLYLMRVPDFNATMYPNGMMTVWSGLLLRVKNEAELGAVLGHEFGHFELRHSLNGFKQARSSSDIMAWASLFLPGNTALSLTLVGSFYAFNRGQEKEADLQGLAYLGSSPFPSSAAANVWERLMAEQDATALGRKRKANHRYTAGFTASHPTELARATYLRAEAAKIGDDGDTRSAEYHAGIAKWLPEFLDDQIKRNDFGGSEYLFKELASDGWSPDLLYARAELYRQRGNPRDLVTASQLYEEAIAKGLTRPEAKRGLGLALMRSQQADSGKTALKQYLDAVPGAPDALMISALIAN